MVVVNIHEKGQVGERGNTDFTNEQLNTLHTGPLITGENMLAFNNRIEGHQFGLLLLL